jgi:beta-lactamase superfamily II metal-dependent hydrolase
LYWAVGNPGPDYDPSNRKGDNLYSCSVLALDPNTGRLVWHYQFTPHDTHDWDATEDLILTDVPIDGHTRKVLLHADRNGFFYTLDRATGRFISAVPFVRQSWNKGFEADGRPIVDPASIATREGHRISPGVGGTNFQPPSYDRARQVLFLSFMDAEVTAAYQLAQYQRGQLFTGAHFGARQPPLNPPEQGVMALDVQSGRKLWAFPLSRGSLQAGVLGTRGDVVFAATAEGNLIALDARTGQSLWHFQTGGPIMAAPISYGVDGKQFIAIAAGNTLYSFALPDRDTQAEDEKLRIDAIDVEGGAATLYITPERRSLLIDTGWPAGIGAKDPDSAQRIIAAARRHGLSKLDYVLVTHYHVDHVGGLAELLSQFPVGTILDHGPNRETPSPRAPPAFAAFQPAALYPKYLEAIRGHEHRTLKPGETLGIGSLRLTAVTSDGAVIARALPGAGGSIAECDGMNPLDENGGEENARSLGVILTFGQSRIASFGDLTWNIEKTLVCPRDKVGLVDLFFVSNHGTHLNNSPALLHALAPRIAIVGNGAKKGGDAESYETVARSPRLARLWQVHFAERADAEHNAPETYIANPISANDTHASLEITVTKEGVFTVTNDRTGFTETYLPPSR